MPIEFRCNQCGRLLRTGDETAGRQAKCPECGGLTAVPEPGASPPEAGGGESPFGAGSPFGPPPGSVPYDENPYASPGEYAAPQLAVASGAIAPTIIDFGDVFGRTWTIFKQHWPICMGVFVLAQVVSQGFGFVVGAVAGVIGVASRDPVVMDVASWTAQIASWLFSTWIGIGQAIFFLKTARGQPAGIGDIFNGGPYFITTVAAGILFALASGVGYLLCVIPGVIIALMFSQYFYLIIDRNVGIIESLSLSAQITRGNKATIFAVLLVATLVGVLVILFTCLIGTLAVGPYWALLMAVVYLAITGQPTADIALRQTWQPTQELR